MSDIRSNGKVGEGEGSTYVQFWGWGGRCQPTEIWLGGGVRDENGKEKNQLLWSVLV